MADDFSEIYEGIIRDLYRRSTEAGPRPKDRHYLLGPDDKFLGKLTANQYDAAGIFNQYGPYGSKYSSDSIFNEYGPYGSQYSNTSPWNLYATKAPRIYLDNHLVGTLTKNRYQPGSKDPDEFLKRIQTDPQYRY